MTATPDDPIKHIRAQVLDAAITGIREMNKFHLLCGDEPYRKSLLTNIFALHEKTCVDLSKAAFGDCQLNHNEKHMLNRLSLVSNLYMAAIVHLIIHGNAQWDDPDILPDQLIAQMRALLSSAGHRTIRS